MSNVVLGVCGSVAAYRACDLARDMKRAGHEVRVCLTDSASQFVSPALFEALTGEPCLTGVFDEPIQGRMAHIDWARWADLVLVAPATSNTLGEIAHGEAKSMLTALITAAECPLIVAPAMNPSMYSHSATQESLYALRRAGVLVVEPKSGEVACGENGQGKLAANSEIFAAVSAVLGRRSSWAGKKVVVTSGPTREMIDDVRFISNRSSGKMGRAVVQALLWAGADVHLVSGPVPIVYPALAETTWVETAEEMLAASLSVADGADVFIGVAAVSDYRPAKRVKGKVRRSDENLMIQLVPNPDITASIAAAFPSIKVVAFAAEPDSDTQTAREKMARKGANAIAVNDISRPGLGFESNENQIHLIFWDGEVAESPNDSKLSVGIWLVDQLSRRL